MPTPQGHLPNADSCNGHTEVVALLLSAPERTSKEDLGAALDVAIHLNNKEVATLLQSHFRNHYKSETTDATEVGPVMRQQPK